MRTTLTILRPGAEPETVVVDLAPKPTLRDIQAALAPYFGLAYTERVAILSEDGKPTDMFVDEIGLMKGLPRNDKATEHYRRNWLSKHPNTPPEHLGFIVGTAVVFDRRIWF